MTAFGNPKHICEECERDLDEATISREPEIISAAIEKIGKKMQSANNDDALILSTVSEIIENATERGEMIRNGVYDFENDEIDEFESVDEVPEDLLETEEDKARDAHDKKANEKFDKIMNYVSLGLFIAFVGAVLYWVLSKLF